MCGFKLFIVDCIDSFSILVYIRDDVHAKVRRILRGRARDDGLDGLGHLEARGGDVDEGAVEDPQHLREAVDRAAVPGQDLRGCDVGQRFEEKARSSIGVRSMFGRAIISNRANSKRAMRASRELLHVELDHPRPAPGRA